MSAQWEVQKAIYTALSTDTAFMTKVGSRLYDEPPTNETFPYCVIGNMIEIRYNRINNIGFQISARIDVYSKSGRLGYKPAKEILAEIDRVLNHKIFSMTGYTMIQCFFDSADTERDGDKRIVTANYTILVQKG